MADAVINAPSPTGEAPPVSPTSEFMTSVMDQISKGHQEPAAAQPMQQTQPDPKAPDAPASKDAPAKTEDVPENFTSAKAADWKLVKSQRDEAREAAKKYESQFSTLDTEHKTLKTKHETLAKEREELAKTREALAKERDDYSTRLERVAIEQHPKFQQHFQLRFDQSIKDAKGAAGDKGDQVLAILEAPPSKWRKDALQEIISGMEGEVDKLTLISALRDYDRTRAERDQVLGNSKEEYKKLQEQMKVEATEKQKQVLANREAAYQRALESARKHEAFKIKDGDEAHNKAVAANEAALKRHVMGEVDEAGFVEAPILAAEAKRLRIVNESITKERDELKSALAQMQAANPGMRGGAVTQPGQSTTADSIYGPSEFMGAVMKQLEAGPGRV